MDDLHVKPTLIEHEVIIFLNLNFNFLAWKCLPLPLAILTQPVSFLASGARSSHSSILVKLQELNEAQATLEEKSAQLQSVIKELDAFKKVAEKYVNSSLTVTSYSYAWSIL